MASKMVAVRDLTPGYTLSDAVISLNGKVLLGQDVELTQRMITLLISWDIQNVFVKTEEDKQEEAPVAQAAAAGVTARQDAEAFLRFVAEYDSLVTTTAQSFEFIYKRKIVPVPHLKDAAASIHSCIDSNGLTALNYLLISDYNLADYISRHSVMVAFFAGIIARQMKWSEADIKGVALAGLLHDVGNLAAEKREDPRTRTYIQHAASLLRETRGISNEVILGIVQHREFIDGTGFPMGANGAKIHPYAKVIAVADIFHGKAYTGETPNPFPVLNVLAQDMFGKLDTAVCHTFIGQIRDSMINNKVILTDGSQAEVIFFHPSGYSLPVVRADGGQIIDLSQRGGLGIKRIVSPALGIDRMIVPAQV